MIYTPAELRAVRLRDAPAGSIISFPGDKDFSRLVRLADLTESSNLIMPLSGMYAFQVIPWSEGGEITTQLCAPAAVSFRLGEPSTDVSYHTPGALTLHPSGAFIATQRKNQMRAPKINVTNWGVANATDADDGCVVYSSWEVGYIDQKGDFNVITQVRVSI